MLELVYCRKACHINFNALTLDIAKPLLLIKSLFFRTKLYREVFYVTTIFTVLFDKWPLIFQLIVKEFILKMLIHYYYNSRPNLQLRRKSFWFKNRIFVYFIKKAKLFFFYIFIHFLFYIFILELNRNITVSYLPNLNFDKIFTNFSFSKFIKIYFLTM